MCAYCRAPTDPDSHGPCACIGLCAAGRCRGGLCIVACSTDGADYLVGRAAALHGERVPADEGLVFATVGDVHRYIFDELDTNLHRHVKVISRDGVALGGGVCDPVIPMVWRWTWIGVLELDRNGPGGDTQMTTRQAAARTPQAVTLRIEIDQSAITAPKFPRNAEWWRRFLPPWFVQERSWDMDSADWDLSGITVDKGTGPVVINVGGGDARRAQAIMRYLHRCVLARYMTNPTAHIRLIESPAGEGPDGKPTQP